MNIKKSILLRVRLAFLLVLIFSIGVIVRLVDLQIMEKDRWTAAAAEIGLKFKTVKATRGNIYSDNGSLLATSLPFYKVAFDPSVAGEEAYKNGVDSLSRLLSQFFGDRTPGEYKRRIHNARVKGNRYLIINRKEINYQQKKEMEQWPIFRLGRMSGGVIFEKVEKRFKPFSFLAMRTVGFLNENQVGAGLEYSFNQQLAGQDGQALFQKMAGGSWRPVYDGSDVRPRDGYDIQTTIDVNLQDVAESALLTHLQKHRAEYGCVVVMEVATGEIKAISNLSRNANGYYGERYNYAVGSQGLREPGSTFKLVSMLALLEDTKLKLDDTLDTGNGTFHFYDRVMRDHKPGGYGKISVKEAFEKSSNIAFARLIDTHFGSKPERFIDYIQDLGLTQPLGFQMVGEGIPYVKRPTDPSWSGITLPWMSHGYELALTPLQTLTLYNAVANEGKMIQPIIVKQIKKADKVVERFQPAVINKKICSDKTLKQLRILLEGVVENGTASNIKNSHYRIAGKTGTAKINKDGKYINEYYTSFAGYFPAEKPKYSCIVVINSPKGYQQYGSDVAAPVFKEIADKIYARDLDLHAPVRYAELQDQGVFPLIQAGFYPELETICDQLKVAFHKVEELDWVKTQVVDSRVGWKATTQGNGVVPDVRGMTLRDALYLLENSGLVVEVKGKGRVSKQSQSPGHKALTGSKIIIELS